MFKSYRKRTARKNIQRAIETVEEQIQDSWELQHLLYACLSEDRRIARDLKDEMGKYRNLWELRAALITRLKELES